MLKHSRARCIMSDDGRLSVCLCVSVPRRIPTLLHVPGCNFWGMVGLSSSRAEDRVQNGSSDVQSPQLIDAVV